MRSLAVKKSRRFVLTGQYLPSRNGKMLPARPLLCPKAHDGADGECLIVISCYRNRKCGPGYDLVVYRCKAHCVSFTVYPPCWVPHGRRAVLGDKKSWFQAVTDLNDGTKWPEHPSRDTPTRYTQSRWVGIILKLCGIDPSLTQQQRHQAAVSLDKSFHELESAAQKIRDGPQIGRDTNLTKSRLILNILPSSALVINQLFERGFDLGFWGRLVLI